MFALSLDTNSGRYPGGKSPKVNTSAAGGAGDAVGKSPKVISSSAAGAGGAAAAPPLKGFSSSPGFQ